MGAPILDILFEDEHFIAVNKAAGLLSIPDRYNADRPNLLHQLQEARPDAEILTVHRLDRETSGVICFAKNPEAHRLLNKLFERREVSKFYIALVLGQVPVDEGTIDEPIGPSEQQKGRMVVAPWGKPSRTHFKVLERFKNHTVVKIFPETGRTHQIRVHFAATGYPLAVDALYGQQDAFYLSEVKGRKYQLGKSQEERPLLNRVSLHAHELYFQHPFLEETLNIKAALPKDLRAVLNQLRKWAAV